MVYSVLSKGFDSPPTKSLQVQDDRLHVFLHLSNSLTTGYNAHQCSLVQQYHMSGIVLSLSYKVMSIH